MREKDCPIVECVARALELSQSCFAASLSAGNKNVPQHSATAQKNIKHLNVPDTSH